ncbi:MAG: type IV pilus secretin PilQ [Deltaproteobacteria bacterium]|nr:type IV pilus secretin PilQ [Deltaproteobacteria bacterium]
MEDIALRVIRGERLARLFLIVMVGVFVLGCAGTKEIKKDTFFEKWNLEAKKSTGTSPIARVRSLEIPDDPGMTGDVKTKRKALPTRKVTLIMRDTDISVVLRALAKAARQNIIINSEITGKVSVDFRRVPWDEAFLSIARSRMLTYVWDGNIIRITTVADLKNDLELEKIQREQREQQIMRSRLSPLLTMVIPVDYADSGKLKKTLEGFLTRNDKGEPYGSVTVNEHTNSLVIQATRGDLKRIIPMVSKIDKPTPQIRIEANIVETTKDTARELGIQWGGVYGNTMGSNSYYITPGGRSGTTGESPKDGGYVPVYGSSGISGQGMGINFPVGSSAMTAAGGAASLGLMFGKIGGSILEMQLTALQSEGKLNILSSPSITTLDNQVAFTENGERIPYVSYEDGEQEVKWEDAVLRLEITPHVIDGENMKMKILIKKDEVDPSRTVQGNPYIIKKQTDTTLIVKDGETIVISGLSKQRSSGGDSGVPWLKDIPGLGYLFKGESKTKKLEKVLIFITPHILKPDVVSETGEAEKDGERGEIETEPSASKSNETGSPKTKEKISKDSEKGACKYVIQVASLKEKSNMENLTKRLSDMGYSPTVTEIGNTSSGKWFVVSLKGYQTRREAMDVSASLERSGHGLKCIVSASR